MEAALSGQNPASNPKNDYVILYWQWGPPAPVTGTHPGYIPGAIHVNSDDFETGTPCYFLQNPAVLTAALRRLGVTRTTTVVVYSDWACAAARGWWILTYAGVEDVRFLDGGLAAWVALGGLLAPEPGSPATPRSFGTVIPACPEHLADTPLVESIVASPDETLIVDVRSWEEFCGETSGYRSLEARGRIPGAVWAGDAEGSPGSLYLSDSGFLRTPDEIWTVWAPQGITVSRPVIFYCGAGWRSSLAALYAHLLGLRHVHNYADGWFAWSTIFSSHPDGSWTQRPSNRKTRMAC